MKQKFGTVMALSMATVTLLAGCGGQQNNGEQEKSTLTMGTNATFPPYEFMDDNNQVAGIDADICKAIGEKLGMEVQIQNMEFDSLIPALGSDQIDIAMAGMTITDERKEQVDFTQPYATGIQAIIVKEDSTIATVEDLAGKKVGVQTGTVGESYCAEDLGEQSVQRFDSGVVATQALVNGQIDAVVIDKEPAKAYVEANEGLKVLDTQYAVDNYAAAVKKGNTELLDKVNTALEELKNEGKIDEIIGQYIHE